MTPDLAQQGYPGRESQPSVRDGIPDAPDVQGFRLGHVWVRIEDCGYATPCHVWTGGRTWNGYARRGAGSKNSALVHRDVYEDWFGEIPRGWHVHHLCETKACVNIDHLEAVDPVEHRRRHPVVPGPPGPTVYMCGLCGARHQRRSKAGRLHAEHELAVEGAA